MKTAPFLWYREVPREPCVLGHVYVAGEPILVKFVDNPEADDGDEVDGLYTGPKNEILLSTRLGPKAERETFFHELFHAICDKYHIHMSLKKEDHFAYILGQAIGSVMKQWMPPAGLEPWEQKDEPTF